MTVPVKKIVLVLAAVLIVAAALAQPPSDKKAELQQAYLQGKLSLEEFVARKDSLMAAINADYQAVKPILQNSCFDCHSNQTDYPWYHSLPVIKGMIDDEIKDGLEHLDLSNDFPFGGRESQVELLTDITEEIEEGEMPPWTYRTMHWGRLIEGEKRDSLFVWINNTKGILTNFYETMAPFESEED